ncbi:MAG: hypothetical protein QOK12_656, partial [Mycobacterium sp.]|nr:hypothetical protein [Mycobacterium sp.]
MIRVLLVDDHPLVRTGLRALLEGAADIEVTGEASEGAQGVAEAGRNPPDVVLMDLSMPVLDGIDATRMLRSSQPDVKVVVLTSSLDRDRVREALAAGAVGYVLKDCSADEVRAAVRSAARGHAPIDPRVAGALLPAAVSRVRPLSERERQVLQLVSKGLANKQIGRELGITERT